MSGNDALIRIFFKDASGELIEQGSFPTTKARAFQVNDLLMGRMETLNLEIPSEDSPVASAPESKPTLKLPSKGRVKEFIRSRPNYEFTIEDLVKEFVGREVSGSESEEANKFLGNMRTKAGRVRREIQAEEGGSWDIDFEGRFRIFKFIKSPMQDNEDIETIPVFKKDLGSLEM